MSDRELKAIISATDKASPVFAKVATGADKMGTAVDSAGKKGAKGLTDQGKSATDLNTKMAALGAATAVAAGVLSQWSRSSQEADAIQRQLEASIAATGEEYSTYADRVQAAGEAAVRLGRDDEDASQAISALTQITGSASEALDQMGLVMDLAAAKHMSLESAAELVGKVLEGNVGILNRQGFAIDANATATEALAQVQTAVAGQAEASATTYGRLREEFSNLTDSIGGAAGGFAPLLSMLPGLSVGFSAMGAAVGALAPELTAAGAASAALDLALGPVGIVLAAGAAAIAIYELTKGHDDESAAAEAATKATSDLVTTLHDLAAAGNPNAATGTAWLDALESGLANASLAIDALKVKQTELTGTSAPVAIGEADTELAALEKQIEALQGATEHATDAEVALNDILADTGTGADLARKAAADLYSEFARTHDIAALVSGLIEIDRHLGDFDVTANEAKATSEKLAPAIDAVTSAIGDLFAVKLSPELLEDIETIKTLGGTDAKMALDSYRKQFEAGTITLDQFGTKVDMVSDRLEVQAASAAKVAAIQGSVGDSAGDAAAGIGDTIPVIKASTDQLEAMAQAARSAADALVGTSSFASKIRPVDIDVRGGDKVTGTAADLQKTQSILGSVLGTFKTLDSLGQASEQADSIAQNLIGEPGELATIDRLLKQGRISQDEYTAAIQAGNRISKESGAIENDLNTIRAKQLPLLADADRQYGNLIDRISHMSAEQATATLGFMDSAESMKAQNAVALAASAAMGELGDAGEATATKIIAGAAEADPVLKEMLKNIGLVTEDKEGNIKVNFPNAESLNDSVDTLTGSINDLAIAIDLLDGKPDLDITVKFLADQAKKDAADTKKAINDIPEEHNTTVTETGSDSTRTAARGTKKDVEDIPDSSNTTITVDDQASGPIGNVIGLLNSLEGRSVSTTITNTVNNVTNNTTNNATNGAPSSPFDATGGMVNFASGGLVTLAEAGPELLRFANGGMGMAMSRGMYAVPDSTLVYNAPATKAKMGGGGGQTFNITVQGDINGMSGVNEVMAAFKIAAREHFAGYRS